MLSYLSPNAFIVKLQWISFFLKVPIIVACFEFPFEWWNISQLFLWMLCSGHLFYLILTSFLPWWESFFNFDFIHNIIYKSIWSTDKLYKLLHQLQCTSSQFNYNKDNYYTLKVCEYIFLQSLYRATAVDLICCRDNRIWKRKKMLGHHNISFGDFI